MAATTGRGKPVRKPSDSPWRTLSEAGARVGRSKRFMRRQWKDGRLRGARIGGRGEILTTEAWVDQWVSDFATPIAMPVRRVG